MPTAIRRSGRFTFIGLTVSIQIQVNSPIRQAGLTRIPNSILIVVIPLITMNLTNGMVPEIDVRGDHAWIKRDRMDSGPIGIRLLPTGLPLLCYCVSFGRHIYEHIITTVICPFKSLARIQLAVVILVQIDRPVRQSRFTLVPDPVIILIVPYAPLYLTFTNTGDFYIINIPTLIGVELAINRIKVEPKKDGITRVGGQISLPVHPSNSWIN